MPNMADISAPLRKLTEKDVEWKWTETEENSFNKLKKLATEATHKLKKRHWQSCLGAKSSISLCMVEL